MQHLFLFLLYGTYNILRAIALLFFSNLFQPIATIFFYFSLSSCPFWCAEKFMPSQLYLSIKGVTFDIFSGWFPIFWWFNEIVRAYWKQLLSSSFFGFIAAPLFLIHLGDSACDPARFNFILWRLYTITQRFQNQNH